MYDNQRQRQCYLPGLISSCTKFLVEYHSHQYDRQRPNYTTMTGGGKGPKSYITPLRSRLLHSEQSSSKPLIGSVAVRTLKACKTLHFTRLSFVHAKRNVCRYNAQRMTVSVIGPQQGLLTYPAVAQHPRVSKQCLNLTTPLKLFNWLSLFT